MLTATSMPISSRPVPNWAVLYRCKLVSAHLLLTPSVMADYMYYNPDSYTESGAGGANLRVDQDSFNKLDLGAGIGGGLSLPGQLGRYLETGHHGWLQI